MPGEPVLVRAEVDDIIIERRCQGAVTGVRSGSVRSLLVVLSLSGSCLVRGAEKPAERPRPQTATGTITGVVRYTGKVPPPKKIMTTDGGEIQHNDLVVDPKNKGLRYVVAILENAPARAKVQKAKPVLVDQRAMIFTPRVVAVQHGQAVRFENSDLCNHSVMASSTSKANQFNLFVTPGRPYTHVFELQKHPVQIGCSLHSWMRAWVFVVPHPWFAVTDAKGKFYVEKVPPGKYTLWLRHPDTGHQQRRPLEVKAGKTTQLNIEWKKIDP
jgi:plastocyanin